MKRHGDRGALSPSTDDEAGARPQDATRHLLRGMDIAPARTRCGRWTSPTSPMARGFVYLAVVLDWFSRRVLVRDGRIDHHGGDRSASMTLGGSLWLVYRQARMPLLNTDQGSQFTGSAFTRRARRQRHSISMDGKGACAVQRVPRASMAQRQIRGSVSRAYDKCIRRLALRSAAHLDFYPASPTRALTAPRPIKRYFTRAAAPLAASTPAEAPLIDAGKSVDNRDSPLISSPSSARSFASFSGMAFPQ